MKIIKHIYCPTKTVVKYFNDVFFYKGVVCPLLGREFAMMKHCRNATAMIL
jgi:hypothetical protein